MDEIRSKRGKRRGEQKERGMRKRQTYILISRETGTKRDTKRTRKREIEGKREDCGFQEHQLVIETW